jgi:ppGpp synthetase/RelA/SpoT-type nucleotidyltranferase
LRFSGLRCEIQIQTILNHVWAKTSHNILYKAENIDNFGGKARENIARRFAKVMDKYLIPAGYEIQKAQQDFERILKVKILVDRDIVNLMDQAKNNNDRYEILLAFKNYVMPNYDDLKK